MSLRERNAGFRPAAFAAGGHLIVGSIRHSFHAFERVARVVTFPSRPSLRTRGCQSSCLSEFALRSEEHTSELQSHHDLVCRLLLEKKKKNKTNIEDVYH